MKSDLTCPVEIVRVTIQRETEDTNENGQILCLIDFFNLSDKVIDSIQMNIICFDAEDQRLGGRLVRAGAHGEPRENFSGAFAPEHVENVARVEAAVEKVWYQDGVIWRREERNVREYSPNALPPGRELDRLRSVAGPDAVGYAREDDTVWLCVCGRANRTSDDRCLRCGRDRAHTVKAYSFAAIDSTLGRKERMLEEKTRETLRRSSEQTVQQMKDILGANPVAIQIPIGAEETFKGIVDLIKMKAIYWHDESMGADYSIEEIPADLQAEAEEWRDKMLEALAECDDAIMEKYFDDPSTITEEEIHTAIRKGTLAMQINPMTCGSSFKNKGVQTLLDAVCAYLPSPEDTEAIEGTDPSDPEKVVVRKPLFEEPMAALAFKIATDPYVGRLCFFRVYSGSINAGSYVLNTRSGKKERISRLFQMHSNKQNPMETIGCGDIGAGVGFKDIRTGDTLCDENAPITLESMDFPDPVIGIAVEPKTQKDLDKLGMGLAKLAEEDPTFTVQTNEETGQTVISGMGELHLDIIIDRLRREFKVECNQGKPQVTYKEAITKSVELREVYKKQSGGRGKFADIIVRIEPADEGFEGSLQFIDEVKGGNVPKEFIPSVQKGFEKAMKNGVLAGYPLDQLKVTLIDGSFHPVDSDQLSFEIAAIQAFKNASEKAGPALMEPIMQMEVVTPEESMGDVIGDLNKRRGQVEGMETSRTGARIVKAKVPLAETFGYVTALRTITSGRATSSMQFSHYAQVSSSIAKQVLTEVQGRADLIK